MITFMVLQLNRENSMFFLKKTEVCKEKTMDPPIQVFPITLFRVFLLIRHLKLKNKLNVFY